MSDTARAKYQDSGAPPEFRSSLPVNPRKEYNSAEARPSGRSGGGPAVSTPHRVSSSIRKSKRSRSRG
jgi:hypothetical protein